MKAVDFYHLPRSVQDRFLACVLGSAEPRPIVSSKAPPTKLLAWGLTAFLSLGLLLFLADLGFGTLGEPFAVQPIEFMGGYIALAGALFFAIGKAAAFWSASLALPFPPGIYLFPGCLIDATSATFRVFPMAELARTDAPPGKVQSFRVVFGKESFDFLMGPGQKITAVDKAVAEGRAAMATAELDGGEQQRYALDPLVEMKFSSPLGPKDAMVREASLLEAWLLPVVGVTAVLLGGVGFFARNRASDDRLYASAKSRNDAESFRAYLALGTRHRNAVETILLPRAELSEAQAKGTLAALEQYRDNHPSSQIMAEVNDALRKAELRELEAAKAQGTLAALELFATKHPDHGVKKEWAAAKHAIYTKALGEFRGRANPKDSDMLKWFDALITHAEAHGPKVEVHFRRRSNETLDEADAAISKSSRFRGPSSLPSHYFDEAHLEAAEREAGTALVELLQKPFSKEVLEFEFGPALGEANPLKTPTKVPMVLVDYELQWGGSVFAFRDPKGAILGFNVVFDGLFALPPGEKGHRFRAESWRAPDSKLWKSLTEDDIQLGEGDHTREGRVYETMRRDAFNLLVRKASGVLYRASAP